MTALTDTINSLFVDGTEFGTSNATLRTAFNAVITASLANNDTISGTLASITENGLYEGLSSNISDFPPLASSGAFTVLSVKLADLSVFYLLLDSTKCLHTGGRASGGAITWKTANYLTTVAQPSVGTVVINNDDANAMTMVFTDTIGTINLQDGSSHIITFGYDTGLTSGTFDDAATTYFKDSGAVNRAFKDIDDNVVTAVQLKALVNSLSTVELKYDTGNSIMVLRKVIQNSSTSAVPSGILKSDGSVQLDPGFTPTNANDLVDKEYVDTNVVAPTIPASYPKGYINGASFSGIDAVTNPYVTSVTMTGAASRIYRAFAKVYFSANAEMNGEIYGSFVTRTSGGAAQLTYPFSKNAFDMQLVSSGRGFEITQHFNKSDAGRIDFTFQLKGTWNAPLDTSVYVIVDDIGEGTAPLPIGSSQVPVILSSAIYDDQTSQIEVISDVGLNSTDTSGITVSNNTVLERSFNGTTMHITVSTAFTPGEDVTWSYDANAAGSDLASAINDIELASGTFNVVNNIGGIDFFFEIDTLAKVTGTGTLTNGNTSAYSTTDHQNAIVYTLANEIVCRGRERVDHSNSTDYGYGGTNGIEYI